MKVRNYLCLALIVAVMGFAHSAQAIITIGDIQVFYNADNSKVTALWPDYMLGVQDGAIFVIENNSNTSITNGIFSIGGSATPDSFNVGTIAAHSHVFIEPGLSNDGGSGHTFFQVLGGIRDESDSGPNDNNVAFQFNGLLSGTA